MIRRHPRRPIGSLALLKCRDGLDVLHNAASILLHRQAGLFEEVLFEPDAHLTGIVWDNGYIWAGSTAKGIFVLNEAGDVVARIGKEAGLPPADHGMKLCRVGLHEVVAVGSFGPNDRAWCALVTYRESKPQVEVFHTATNAVIFSRSGPARLDPQTAFRPEWVVPHPDETGQETNRVLVGRGVVLSRPGKSTNLFPSLQIDVRSRTVSVPRGPELDWIRRWQPTHHLLPNGNVIIPYRSEVRVQPPPTRERIVGSRVLFGIDRDYGLSRRLVVHDGFFYVTGVTWFRIDPRTLDVERLVPGFLPKAHQLGTGVSGHFGLVQWNRHLEFFRVIVGDSMPTTRRNTSTERVKQ